MPAPPIALLAAAVGIGLLLATGRSSAASKGDLDSCVTTAAAQLFDSLDETLEGPAVEFLAHQFEQAGFTRAAQCVRDASNESQVVPASDCRAVIISALEHDIRAAHPDILDGYAQTMKQRMPEGAACLRKIAAAKRRGVTF